LLLLDVAEINLKLPGKNIIVTAADRKYFRCMYQLILSYLHQKEYRNSNLILYNLGLDESQIDLLRKDFLSKQPQITLIKFDFGEYPAFVGDELKIYAWKPQIILEVLDKEKGNILWLDSANIILKPLTRIWQELTTHHVYAPVSGSGGLSEWTFDKTLEYLNVPASWHTYRNRAGNLCGFGHGNETMKRLVEDWARLCLEYECIQPEGANRANHRWDQSILSILLYKAQQNDGLHLTCDEVNISSARPISEISVRNILAPNTPLFYGKATIGYFRVLRLADILINRLKSY